MHRNVRNYGCLLLPFLIGILSQANCATIPTEMPIVYNERAGYAVFRVLPNNERQYLLLKEKESDTGRLTLPDEHCISTENNHEIAVRALKNHTGLTNDEVAEVPYYFKMIMHGYPIKVNSTIFWFGELLKLDSPIQLSAKHSEYKWVIIDDVEDVGDEIAYEALSSAEIFFIDGMYESVREKKAAAA